jgi:hypothetical protein
MSLLVEHHANKKVDKTLRIIVQWKKRVERVISMKEFHNRDDFEVNLIKFTKNISLSLNNKQKTDYTFLSKCFHLSQKGHSIFALSLWN